MKVLVLGSGSYLSMLSSRIRVIALQLAKNNDVTVMTPSADKYNNFKPNKNIETPGIRLIQPWQFTTTSAIVNLIPYLFTSLFSLLTNRYDVIYLYKPTPVTILGLVPKLLFGTPVILDMDDLGSEVMKAEGQPAFYYRLVEVCEKLSERFSSGTIVTSTFLRSIIETRYPDKKILILSNGVEPSKYHIEPSDTLQNNVYFFGGINRIDIINSLLEAMPKVIAAVPDVQLLIGGGGKALDSAKLLAQELKINGNVTFTGWFKDEFENQRYVHFGGIGICYQPDSRTLRASSNMKVFQYMVMGLVPIVSDVGDLSSYVMNGEAGVAVPAGNTEALSDAIISLLNNPKKRLALAYRAYELAHNEYSWEHQLAYKLNQFIYSIIGGSKDTAK